MKIDKEHMKKEHVPMIDSHAHLHDPRFDNDRDDVLRRARDAGMVGMVTVGTNEHTSRQAIACAQQYDRVFATVGMHPLHTFTAKNCEPEERFVEDFDRELYMQLACDPQVVAIGEVGLDYHHFSDTDNVDMIKEKQRVIFKEFIGICNAVQKPIVVHCWDGYDDVLEILMSDPVSKRGVIHSYIGSWKHAQKFTELGYRIGVNGIVTYGESYDKLLRNIDLDDLLLETDCPYLPPRPLLRDGRCEPRDVYHVAMKVAQVKDISVEEVLEVTTENTKRLFGF